MNEEAIWQAYQNLAADSSFELSVNGTETIGKVTTPFNSVLYFTTATNPETGLTTSAKLELDDYDGNGNLLRRYVGDGQTLWYYDLSARRYSASFYSFYGTTPPATYPGSDAPRMLAQLYPESTGPTTYVARLLREVNPGSNLLTPTYSSWAPGETPMVPLSSPATPDPLVPSRSYESVGADEYVVYGPGSANPKRSVAFELHDLNGGTGIPNWTLNNVYFADQKPNRFEQWTLNVTTGSTLPTWAFVPFTAAQTTGWQPTVAPRPFSG